MTAGDRPDLARLVPAARADDALALETLLAVLEPYLARLVRRSPSGTTRTSPRNRWSSSCGTSAGYRTRPPLLVGGERDFFFPPRLLRSGIEQTLAVELCAVTGAGHYLHVECPGVLAELTVAHFRGDGAAKRRALQAVRGARAWQRGG